MKLHFVRDLGKDTQVVDFFLVTKSSVRDAKNKTQYASYSLSDKTGTVDARHWGCGTAFPENTVVKVEADVDEYQGKLQLKISRIRQAELGEECFSPDRDDPYVVEASDFAKCSVRSYEDMEFQLRTIVSKLEPECLKDLASRVFLNNQLTTKKFLTASAAKTIHNAYIGGLAEHTLSMCVAADRLAEHYEVDRNLAVVGCLLHDVGKIHELETSMLGVTRYSAEGNLLGHIQIGLQVVTDVLDQMRDEFPWELRLRVLHMVASHHGKREWGSPVVPATKEALLLHAVDVLDARMFMFDASLEEDQSSDPEYTAPNYKMDGAHLFKGVRP